MSEPVRRFGVFIRTFRSCMNSAWWNSDNCYHIPKSRFSGGCRQVYEDPGPPPVRRDKPGRRGLRQFRSCLSTAWRASDTYYHIPKSRKDGITQKRV